MGGPPRPRAPSWTVRLAALGRSVGRSVLALALLLRSLRLLRTASPSAREARRSESRERARTRASDGRVQPPLSLSTFLLSFPPLILLCSAAMLSRPWLLLYERESDFGAQPHCKEKKKRKKKSL